MSMSSIEVTVPFSSGNLRVVGAGERVGNPPHSQEYSGGGEMLGSGMDIMGTEEPSPRSGGADSPRVYAGAGGSLLGDDVGNARALMVAFDGEVASCAAVPGPGLEIVRRSSLDCRGGGGEDMARGSTRDGRGVRSTSGGRDVLSS